MGAVVPIETEAARTVLVHGSYLAHFRLYDTRVVSERDGWFEDLPAATVRTAEGVRGLRSEQANCARTTGASVLPGMLTLQAARDDRVRRLGAQPLPGRPLV
jgi:hypothetical protein